MATLDARSDLLAAGEAALERAAWEDARTAFQRALETAEGPEALEGLATAAGNGGAGLAAELRELAELREQGVLGDEEFAQAKANLLSSS